MIIIDPCGRNALRPAEARAVRCVDVDLDRRELNVTGQMNRQNKRGDVKKASHAARTILWYGCLNGDARKRRSRNDQFPGQMGRRPNWKPSIEAATVAQTSIKRRELVTATNHDTTLRFFGRTAAGPSTQPVQLGGPKQRLVLALLAVAHEHGLSTEALIERLWVDRSPNKPRHTLQVHVANIRRSLAAIDVGIDSTGGTYRLVCPRTDIDFLAFDDEISSAVSRGGPPIDSRQRIEAALQLWTGEPFADLVDVDDGGGLASTRSRLNELRLAGQARLWAIVLDNDGPAAAVPALETLAADHPVHEEFWRLLMLALYRQGQQGGALRAFQRARTALGDELGIEPSPMLRDLEAAILRHDAAVLTDVGSDVAAAPIIGAGNRPTGWIPLVGRGEEVDRITEAIAMSRLVTVVGTGGVGKTRLADAVASAAGDPDNTVVVELAPLGDDAEVGDVIAKALDLRDLEAGTPALDDRPLLIVLDNCEHVLEGVVAATRRILRSVPGARMLATSRRPLGIEGERVVTIQPLATPASDDVATVLSAPAAVIFLHRARTAGANIKLDDVSAQAVAKLCRALDGLPLALELAAARAGAMTPSEMLGFVDERFRWLGRRDGNRGDNLQATLDWSYESLDEPARRIFRHLGVIRGSFLVDDVAVLVPDVDPLDLTLVLSDLVDGSMVEARQIEGRTSYRLLHSVRGYALQLLDQHRESTAAIAARNAAIRHFYTGVAEIGVEEWDAELSMKFYGSYPDVRVALDDELRHDADQATVLALMQPLWVLVFEGHSGEVARLADTALARWPNAGPKQWGYIPASSAMAHLMSGDWRHAVDTAQSALTQLPHPSQDRCILRLALGLSAKVGGELELADEILTLGAEEAANVMPAAITVFEAYHALALGAAGRDDDAIQLATRAEERARDGNDPYNAMWALQCRGTLHLTTDTSTARHLIEDSIAEATQLNAAVEISHGHMALAAADLLDGYPQLAATGLHRCLDPFLRSASRPALANLLRWVACVLAECDAGRSAAMLTGFCQSRVQWSAPVRPAATRLEHLARDLDPDDLAAGRLMETAEACTIARSTLSAVATGAAQLRR